MSILDKFIETGFLQTQRVAGDETLKFGSLDVPCMVDSYSQEREVVPGFRTNGDNATVAILAHDGLKVPGLDTVPVLCIWRDKNWHAKILARGRTLWTLKLESNVKRDGAS